VSKPDHQYKTRYTNKYSFFYLISILFQVLLARHHKREKRFGPSPTNNYTHGSRGAFWRRNKNSPGVVDADNTLPDHPTPMDVEMGAKPKNEKKWFNSWGRNKNSAATAPVQNGNGNGYGYGNSAYTGNI
jgi:hypothetical protein